MTGPRLLLVLWLTILLPGFAVANELLSGTLRKHQSIMLLIEPASGRIVDANEAAARFYGQPIESLRGMVIQDLNVLGPAEIAAERALAAAEQRNFFVFPHRVADGSIRTVEVFSSPIQLDGRGPMLLSVIRDVTGKEMAQGDMLAYQQRLEDLVAQRTADISRINEQRNRQLVYGLLAQGAVIVLLLLVMVSRRRLLLRNREALEQLGAVSRYSRALIEASLDPLVTISPDGRITDVNLATETATGMPRDKLIGSDFSDYFTDPDKAREGYRAVFAKGQVIDYPLEIRHVSGQGMNVLYNASLYRDDDGRVVGVFAAARDVTARKQAEEALAAYQAQLEDLVDQRTAQLTRVREQLLQSEKLASIGQLAAGVAHEINNPVGYVSSNLNTLKGYVDELVRLLGDYRSLVAAADCPAAAQIEQRWRQLDVDFLQRDLVELLHESSEGLARIRKIVQDLKDFSRVDREPVFAMADLHDCIESSLNVAANEIKYKADVVREYGDLPQIECVASQLAQVCLNLVVNAAQAMGEQRGQITVRTGCADGKVWLSISDTGCGMSDAVIARVFDPFFTTKEVGKGTGLGLSISFGIIEQHHGSIEVDSREGAGTTFRITLPVHQPAHVKRVASAPSVPAR